MVTHALFFDKNVFEEEGAVRSSEEEVRMQNMGIDDHFLLIKLRTYL
jgi:hypothetical protein